MTDAPLPPASPAAAPAPETTIVELPYHRLYGAAPTFRWWRPLVAVLLTAVFFFAVSLVIAIPVFVAMLASGAIDLSDAASQDELTAMLMPDMARPWTLLFGLGSIILVLPFIPLALHIAGIRPAGVRVSILHSVVFRLRWRWLLATLGWSAAVWFSLTAVQLLIGAAWGDELEAFTTDPTIYLVSMLIVLALVPIQAATEEYLYRGVLLQSIGAWVRWAPFGVVISAVLFAVSHAYDPWGLVQVGVMGVGFAVVAIRTGGLEAGIALHAVNNIGSFALSGTGMFGPTGMTSETGGPIAVLWLVATVVIWVAVIEWRSRRRGIERLSRIAIVPAPVVPAPVLPPPTAPGIPGPHAG